MIAIQLLEPRNGSFLDFVNAKSAVVVSVPLLKEGVDDKELAEAKKSYLEAEKVRRANDGALTRLLAGDLFTGRTFEYYAGLEKKITALTPAEVNEAIRKHFVPQKLVAIRAGDFAKNSQ